MMAIRVEHLSEPEKLLWSYGVTRAEHIDLDGIARDRGAEVRYRPLCGCEARLVAVGERAIISVNLASKPERQRFSLGHELAHWLRDRRTGGYFCAQEDVAPQNAEAKSAEAQANAYASQLLMPDYLVERSIAGRKVSLDTAKQLGAEFRASLTAAALKLVRLATVPACVLCHNQKGLMWFRKSATMPDDMYVPRELHHETEAFGMVFESGERMSRPTTEAAARWLSGASMRTATVESQTVRLAEGVVLTVVAIRQAPRRPAGKSAGR